MGVGPACFYPKGKGQESLIVSEWADGSSVDANVEDEFSPIRAHIGDCNDNPYKIPKFFEERLSCNMPLNYMKFSKRNPLEEPSKEECLSIGLISWY